MAPSCPRALLFLGELPAEAGMEADDESYPSPRDVPGCGAVGGPEMPCSPGGGGFCPGRRQMLRFRFAVSLVFVHAEEGGPAGGDGGGVLAGAGGAVACVR